MVREYLTIFGAVEPEAGDFVYTITQKEKKEKQKRGRKKKGVKKKKPKKKVKGTKSRQMNEF